jgi:hypothetical protein
VTRKRTRLGVAFFLTTISGSVLAAPVAGHDASNNVSHYYMGCESAYIDTNYSHVFLFRTGGLQYNGAKGTLALNSVVPHQCTDGITESGTWMAWPANVQGGSNGDFVQFGIVKASYASGATRNCPSGMSIPEDTLTFAWTPAASFLHDPLNNPSGYYCAASFVDSDNNGVRDVVHSGWTYTFSIASINNGLQWQFCLTSSGFAGSECSSITAWSSFGTEAWQGLETDNAASAIGGAGSANLSTVSQPQYRRVGNSLWWYMDSDSGPTYTHHPVGYTGSVTQLSLGERLSVWTNAHN